jgi:hypothetical protein
MVATIHRGYAFFQNDCLKIGVRAIESNPRVTVRDIETTGVTSQCDGKSDS